ncbi:hypothetical protein [Roseibium sp.]|uniref:hypothetical protein n=1 Tax=Roseibium sp. TaxID=1936156 RepID=UPI0032640069
MLRINPVKYIALMTSHDASIKATKFSVSNFKKWAVSLFSKNSENGKVSVGNTIQEGELKAVDARHDTCGRRKVSSEIRSTLTEEEKNNIHETVGRRVSFSAKNPTNAAKLITPNSDEEQLQRTRSGTGNGSSKIYIDKSLFNARDMKHLAVCARS